MEVHTVHLRTQDHIMTYTVTVPVGTCKAAVEDVAKFKYFKGKSNRYPGGHQFLDCYSYPAVSVVVETDKVKTH